MSDEKQFFKKLISPNLQEEAEQLEDEEEVFPITKSDLAKTALAGIEVALGIIEARGLATREEIQEALMVARADIEDKIIE